MTLAHITALTESEELEWREDTHGYYTALFQGDTIDVVRSELWVHQRLRILHAHALEKLIDGRQPLPEWAQKVGE